MKILITGAGGVVGSYLREFLSAGNEVLALKHRDLDITDADAVMRAVSTHRPDLIINGAVVQVDDCERDPALAQAINVEGPRVLAEAAAQVEADLVHFSTNYVFDGAEIGRTPYTIRDETRPLNVYGQTKLEGEKAVQAVCKRTFVIRTAWVYGPRGTTFLSRIHRDILGGKQVAGIADLWANPTYVADLALRLREILRARRYGVYHVVNSGLTSYYEYALEAARLAGLSEAQAKERVAPQKEAEIQRLAARPRYTPMHCLLSEGLGLPPLRDWRSALADYVRADRERTA
jgi:dTDP-4-dehydrorhamnose reductase